MQRTTGEELQSIHHGEGLGCHLPGCGCLVLLLVVGGVLAYRGADALNLHPAAYLAGLLHGLLAGLAPQG